MNAIVSVTRDWGIGLQDKLVVPNRADMRRFAQLTCGGRTAGSAGLNEVLGTVIMGRKTLESFPKGPLKARRNIVLTQDETYRPQGVEVAHSLEEALSLVSEEDPETVWLIGGESIYHQLLPHCSRAFVTKNDTSVKCDAFFPNLDENPNWQVEEELPGGVTEAGIPFTYVTYIQK